MIKNLLTTPNGTAAAPAPCVITTDTTLHQGTYYGGIYIGFTPHDDC